MNRTSRFFLWMLLLLSFSLSACIGLLPLEEEQVNGGFGPQISLQEQQTRTFETLWTHLEENYIYFESADVDWDALRDQYQQRIDSGLSTEQFAELMQELAAELPEGSLVYESRQERIERESVDNSSYEGIGAFVGFSAEPEPHMVLLDVIEGSPAEQAGLEAHDSIIEIDGRPILLEEGVSAVDRIRGPAGTTVTLGIQSPGTPMRSVQVERGRLTTTGKLEAYQLEGTNYGYLLFPPIGYETLAQDVTENIRNLTSDRSLEGLILDLRIAGTSRGWPLEGISALFYDGTLGEFYNRENQQAVEVQGQDVNGSQEIPMVVLVGENTTGLPEILAASLRNQERAVVIGETTPGAVESTGAVYLPDGSQVYIASASFALPNGEEIGITGVTPDIRLEAGWDEVLPNRDPVLERAIDYLEQGQ